MFSLFVTDKKMFFVDCIVLICEMIKTHTHFTKTEGRGNEL